MIAGEGGWDDEGSHRYSKADAWSGGMIMGKVHSSPIDCIEHERQLARSAFVAGIPTAIPYDMVRVKDSYGLVFEMVKADVIARKFTDEPDLRKCIRNI